MPGRFGHMINPHLFRDCAATSIMIEAPKHVRIAARLLGHATLRTTERHYILANTRREISEHQKGVLALRRRSNGGRRAPQAGCSTS
jgi:integrase/recombinase XerD